jgi:hypothetical protein
MTLTIDKAISKLLQLKAKSKLGGNTCLVLSMPEKAYHPFSDMELESDDDGAVVTLGADPCSKCSPRTLGFD